MSLLLGDDEVNSPQRLLRQLAACEPLAAPQIAFCTIVASTRQVTTAAALVTTWMCNQTARRFDVSSGIARHSLRRQQQQQQLYSPAPPPKASSNELASGDAEQTAELLLLLLLRLECNTVSCMRNFAAAHVGGKKISPELITPAANRACCQHSALHAVIP